MKGRVLHFEWKSPIETLAQALEIIFKVPEKNQTTTNDTAWHDSQCFQHCFINCWVIHRLFDWWNRTWNEFIYNKPTANYSSSCRQCMDFISYPTHIWFLNFNINYVHWEISHPNRGIWGILKNHTKMLIIYPCNKNSSDQKLLGVAGKVAMFTGILLNPPCKNVSVICQKSKEFWRLLNVTSRSPPTNCSHIHIYNRGMVLKSETYTVSSLGMLLCTVLSQLDPQLPSNNSWSATKCLDIQIKCTWHSGSFPNIVYNKFYYLWGHFTWDEEEEKRCSSNSFIFLNSWRKCVRSDSE